MFDMTSHSDCCWQQEGCSYQAPLRSLLRHEPACSYQLVTCQTCHLRSPLLNFHHHSDQMTCFYQGRMFESPVKVNMSVRETPAVALTYRGEIFYVRVAELKSRAVWLVYLAAQLAESECAQYRMSLQVRGDHFVEFLENL